MGKQDQKKVQPETCNFIDRKQMWSLWRQKYGDDWSENKGNINNFLLTILRGY